MIRISAISYLNTKPFLYGIELCLTDKSEYSITFDIPSVCAEKMILGVADIGLVPVAVLPKLTNHTIVSDYCIGADGPVASVVLLSQKPLNEIKKIVLDYHSKTSVALVQELASNYWEISPEYIHAKEGFENVSSVDTALVIIGDRVFEHKSKFAYCYDLAEEWKKFTKLPFVFAVWVSNKNVPLDFLQKFNNALKFGIENRKDIIAENQSKYPLINVSEYLLNNISYDLDENKMKGMKLFLNYLEGSH